MQFHKLTTAKRNYRQVKKKKSENYEDRFVFNTWCV